ncbi:FAD-dependent oxidoreductase [Nocardia arthritidis]|uniref:FAD-dependent oxidoreductase n=1 Tax=Nocardia arthritidis TaxID=228602 RepID=A0A6G9YLQ0_9NOCA|nr:NAD(P)/FAD-dependent oxidoreductase [Nocardia arthritidis]QIS14134.1 FAD-dependent oxidoreductase [Nocardia arthritidis]
MVTVIGGGIAGTTLAGALARNGHPVTVYERQSRTGTGAFVTLDQVAQDTLLELGIASARLDEAAHPISGVHYHYLPESRQIAPNRGHRLFTRPDLMRLLTEFADTAGISIHHGYTVTEIDSATGTIYSDGRALGTDELVIAADGIDSLVRAHIEPDRVPVFAGQTVMYGISDHPVPLPTEPGVLHFDGVLADTPMPRSTFGHLWNDTGVFWFARLTQDPIPQQDIGFHPTAELSSTVLATAPSAADLIEIILANTSTVHISNTRNVPFADARPPQLPVILCGDADHAITPAAARGAREAIEDAAALTHAILTDRDPAEAMSTRRAQITTDRDQLTRTFRTRR